MSYTRKMQQRKHKHYKCLLKEFLCPNVHYDGPTCSKLFRTISQGLDNSHETEITDRRRTGKMSNAIKPRAKR